MTVHRFLAGALTALTLTGIASCGGGGDGNTNTDNDSAVPPAATFKIGGTVNNLYGAIELQLNGGNTIVRDDARNFAFTFDPGLTAGSTYSVTASADQQCNIANGSGTVGQTDVTDITITCTSVIRSTALNGEQVNPAVSTAASGRGAIIVNPITNELTGGIIVSDLTPRTDGLHIRRAPAGDPTGNGPVVASLRTAGDGKTFFVPAGTVLNADQYAALVAGELYVDVRTDARPDGELRGQLSGRDDVIGALASLDGSKPVPPTASPGLGGGTLILDAETREVIVGYATYLNLANPTSGHLLSGGAPGEIGSTEVVTLQAGDGVFTTPVPSTLSSQHVTELRAGEAYFEIRSADFPNGAIRGQLEPQ